MRWWWIILTECLIEAVCDNVHRLKFKRSAPNNNKTEYDHPHSDHNHDHDDHDHESHHTIIWILVGILSGIVLIGICVGIITCIYCWKKKKGKTVDEKDSKVPIPPANDQTSADKKVDESNPGHLSTAKKRSSIGRTVSSIFGSAPKVEPRAPKTSSARKKRVKLISSTQKKDGERKRNFYMQNVQQESSLLDGSKEHVIPPPPPSAGSKENPNPSAMPPGGSKEIVINSPIIAAVTTPKTQNSNVKNSKTVTAAAEKTKTNTIGGGKTFEAPEVNNNGKPLDGSSTSYEEPEKKSLEVVNSPCHPVGYKPRGPLAPDHIPPEKWKHRGELVIKKRQKVVLKHELENEPHVDPKSSDHVEFDSKMNEVIDFGPGVEKIISNKSTATSISTAASPHVRTAKQSKDINPEKQQPQPKQQPQQSQLQQPQSSSGSTTAAPKTTGGESKKKEQKEIGGVSPVKNEAKTEKTQEFNGDFNKI